MSVVTSEMRWNFSIPWTNCAMGLCDLLKIHFYSEIYLLLSLLDIMSLFTLKCFLSLKKLFNESWEVLIDVLPRRKQGENIIRQNGWFCLIFVLFYISCCCLSDDNYLDEISNNVSSRSKSSKRGTLLRFYSVRSDIFRGSN